MHSIEPMEVLLVERSPLPVGSVYVPEPDVRSFAEAALAQLGLPGEDAASVLDVLLSADLRGIRSHGIARLPYFLSRLHDRVVNPIPQMVFTRRTDTTGLLDADRGLGIVASREAMRHVLDLASEHGVGFVGVTRSSHFGYAGYWTAWAQRQGFVGIAMSNGGGRTAPTFAEEGLLGTNPLSIAIPATEGSTPFHLDMATSMVASGKIETALRDGRPVPRAWLHSSIGSPRLDDRGKLEPGYPLLPLGGEGDETGGHKGYGLALVVELLCGALIGSPLTSRLGESSEAVTSVGHFFGAWHVSAFRDPDEVSADMEETFDVIRSARRSPGQDRIFIPGEPEALAEAENTLRGVAVDPELSRQLRAWGERLALDTRWPVDPDRVAG